MPKAVFDSLEEAKAAFSLGRVKFRCNVCGGSHMSDKTGWYFCLRELIEDLGEEVYYAFPELDELLSERWLPPIWLLPGRQSECMRLQGICDDLRPHMKSFRLVDYLGQAVRSPEVLSLSRRALSDLIENARRRIQEDIKLYESNRCEKVGELKRQYAELKRQLEGKRFAKKISPDIVLSYWPSDTGCSDNYFIYVDGVAYILKLIVNDFLELFPELEKPYEIRGPGERYRSLKYIPCHLEFRDDGFYAVLTARFVRRYSMFTRPRKRWEYHVPQIKDYKEPVYLGVIEGNFSAMTVEKAVQRAKSRTDY